MFHNFGEHDLGKTVGPSKDAEGLPVEVFAERHERRVYKISTLYDSVQEFALLRVESFPGEVTQNCASQRHYQMGLDLKMLG